MTPGRFEQFLAIDWSGARGERQKGIALALAHRDGGAPVLVKRGTAWSREEVLHILLDLPDKTLVGMDLGISLPFADCDDYFPGWDDSPKDARSLWALIDNICKDDPNFEASSFVSHPEARRHYRHAKGDEGEFFHLPHAATREGRFRAAEQAQRNMGCRPVSNFNLVGAAQVGKSSLTGMRVLHRLQGRMPIWPIDPLPPSGSVIVEIYTSLAAKEAGLGANRSKMRSFEDLNQALGSWNVPPVPGEGVIDDHSSDALITAAWLRRVAYDPARWAPEGLTHEIALTEGWTFGAV